MMTKKVTRKGVNKPADVTGRLKLDLEAGNLETATLAEGLAIDFSKLFSCVYPDLTSLAKSRIDKKDGITKRMLSAAELIYEEKGSDALDSLAKHKSDTVRGWGAYLVSVTPDISLRQRISRVRVFANDSHFGVREWAWLAIRPHIAEDITAAI